MDNIKGKFINQILEIKKVIETFADEFRIITDVSFFKGHFMDPIKGQFEFEVDIKKNINNLQNYFEISPQENTI